MSPDDMANFHEHMAEWCRLRASESHGVVSASIMASAWEHDEAYQYWCRQANPGREKARENG